MIIQENLSDGMTHIQTLQVISNKFGRKTGFLYFLLTKAKAIRPINIGL